MSSRTGGRKPKEPSGSSTPQGRDETRKAEESSDDRTGLTRYASPPRAAEKANRCPFERAGIHGTFHQTLEHTMTYVDILKGRGNGFRNLDKAARRKLKAFDAKHVVFGLNRNELGQLSTFFKVFTDDDGFFRYVDDFYATHREIVLAVHR